MAVLHRWFEEVWNKGREEAIDEMFADEGIARRLADENGQELRGPTGFNPFFRKFEMLFLTSRSSSKIASPKATWPQRVARSEQRYRHRTRRCSHRPTPWSSPACASSAFATVRVSNPGTTSTS